MLTLRRITLENFGPFKGTQTIDFPADPGVVVVYGENMRGKTTLLNAIRYAFFGYVTGRGAHQVDLSKVGNWEAAAEGTHGFKVILGFDYSGASYELTRNCKLRQGVTTPSSSLDFVQETLLRRGSDVLGPEQRDQALAEILPEAVSRFFLFDGELLQQYEELLREESTMGRQIKEAIERILGLPVLTNARGDLRDLTKDAQSQEARAAQRDQKTQELGNHHQVLIDQRAHHEKELLRLRGERDALSQKKGQTEDAMKDSERMKALLSERDSLNADIAEIDRKLADRRGRVREMMAQAWRWLLQPRVAEVAATMDKRIDELRADETKRAVAKEMLRLVEGAIESGNCDSCARPLDAAQRVAFEDRVKALRAVVALGGSGAELTPLLQRRATLTDFLGPDKTEVLKELAAQVDDLRVERAAKMDKMEEIREQTKDLDESVIRKLFSDYEHIVQELAILDTGIAAEASEVQKVNDDIRRVQEKLDKIGGVALAKERLRRETCEGLLNLFDQAVGEYRDQLRKKVEADATALFLRLTTESDYAKLSINENYGLTIVHTDGTPIPVRSAGAEHIVALSLMGALQRNAPLRGPIIMDSPFGRLDQGHTTRVVRTLPSMADQVLLLVYEAELEPQLARNELKAQLLREYRLARKSARHSLLEPFTE